MVFATPPITAALAERLGELDELRKRLGARTGTAGPWLGALRRQARASSAESSIEIEGYEVPEQERPALTEGEQTPDPSDEDRMALSCYGRAMDHVGVMAGDPIFHWVDRVILDLHFDACYFQRDKDPGQYRRGPISVTSGDGPPAYVGPPGEEVPALMNEVTGWLERGDLDAHVVVRAAMAHLHVVSVHPFRDGNGRVSRIVQSLVLAREGLLAPELGSIEEYLQRHTEAYYAALRKVQGGRYQPDRDAAPWIEFCIDAHIDQTKRRLDQIAQAGARWELLESLVERRDWPDRLVIALEHSLFQGVDRASYTAEAGISDPTASTDLRRLLDAGLVERQNRGRTTRYVASPQLRADVQQSVSQTG
jgi:Fic family protein